MGDPGRLERFMRERDELNAIVLEHADAVVKRLYSLDAVAFREGGELGAEARELVALAVSLALRCDDCTSYHLGRCADLQVPPGKVSEAMGIASLIGGTITIPHLRRAFAMWREMTAGRGAPDFPRLTDRVREIAETGAGPGEVLASVAALLRDSVPHYDWVGFYLADPSSQRTLVLGPFSGEPTEHVRIGFGQGVCGQAAESGRTLVVDDVGRESNYLSCSPLVRSEAVVPVFGPDGSLAGELDIDSHAPASFTPADRLFLEDVAGILSPLVGAAAAALDGREAR